MAIVLPMRLVVVASIAVSIAACSSSGGRGTAGDRTPPSPAVATGVVPSTQSALCGGSSSPSIERSADRVITLRRHGVGPVDFGTCKEEATAELTRLLGPPSGSGVNKGCGPTFTDVNWGELAVEFHHDVFSGYRDINRPQGNLGLGPADPAGYKTFYPVRPAAKTAAGIALGDSLGRVQAAYPSLVLAGADRWLSRGLSFVDNSLTRSPAPPQARIIEIRFGACGSY
jgi:hypothetical protein